jgi:hypothetical protein
MPLSVYVCYQLVNALAAETSVKSIDSAIHIPTRFNRAGRYSTYLRLHPRQNNTASDPQTNSRSRRGVKYAVSPRPWGAPGSAPPAVVAAHEPQKLPVVLRSLAVPDHSTLSRRSKTLEVPPLRRLGSGPLHLLVDSTGLKLGGAGEWLVEEHGTSSRRSWRKLHIGIDGESGEIVAIELTKNESDDAARTDALLD